MLKQLRPALCVLLFLTLITGVVYPLLVQGVASVVFKHQSTGSVLRNSKGDAIGSELIGQNFDDPKYFWGRLSATGPVPYTSYNATTQPSTSGSGSNLGPTNPALLDQVKARMDALKTADPDNMAQPPVDLVTASASGLDPHISPAAAEFQINRVAKVRHLSVDKVRELVAANTESRQFGIFGEPRVHVLKLNLAMDGLAP